MDQPNQIIRYYHFEYTSPMFIRACWEHRRCVVDVSATFLTFVYLTECSPTVVRCSALFCDISPIVLGDETSREDCPCFGEAIRYIIAMYSYAITNCKLVDSSAFIINLLPYFNP